jgi:hypothetical protein
MKYFIDTEFIERGPRHPIELISIGIVCEDGRTFYAISSEFDPSHASEWVRENVLSHLEPEKTRSTVTELARQIYVFTSPLVYGSKPEFWGYYADYDWVVFCQIFGTMVDLPKGFPMYCRDIKQWCVELGNPQLPAQDSTEHNALNDAKWNKVAWEFLSSVARGEKAEDKR